MQQEDVESIIEGLLQDEANVTLLNDWARFNLRKNPVYAQGLLDRVSEIAYAKNYLIVLNWVEYWRGWILHDQAKYEEAINLHLHTASFFEEHQDLIGFCKVCNALAGSYKYLGSYESAINWARKGLDLTYKQEVSGLRGTLLANVGEAFLILGRLDEAEEALNGAIATQPKDEAIGIAKISLGKINTLRGKHLLALDYFNEALTISTTIDSSSLIASTLVGMAISLAALERDDESIACFKKAITIARKIDDKLNICDFYYNYALVLNNRGFEKKSYSYLKKGLLIAEEIGALQLVSHFSFSLAEYYARKKKWKLAYEYFLKNKNLETIFNDKKNRIAVESLKAEQSWHEAALNKFMYNRISIIGSIGRGITSTHDINVIIGTLYESVNKLMVADVFGIARYNADNKELDFAAIIDMGEHIDGGKISLDDTSSFGAWAMRNKKDVFINNAELEYSKYVTQTRRIKDDGKPNTKSLMYCPLMIQDVPMGLITVQSYKANAYTEHHLDSLKTLGAYAAIALENAKMFTVVQKARAEAEEANQQKSLFLAKMSHELRTPLNAIINFAYLLKLGSEGEVNKNQEEMLARVEDSGRHLLDLINDILDLSKVEAGKMVLYLEKSDINSLIQEVLETLNVLIKDKNVTLRFESEYELLFVQMDTRRIFQVVLNLISNAIKFTDSGVITVSTKKSDDSDFVTISIQDTGRGIAKENLPKVFEEFVQEQDGQIKSTSGTGLGLSICKAFVELHGGKIWAESEKHTGSIFYFTLKKA